MNTLTNLEYLHSEYKNTRPEKPVSYPKIPLLFFKLLLNSFGRLFPSTFAQLAYHLFSSPRSKAKHKKSDELLDQVKHFEFIVDHKKLKGYEWGSGDQIILLVHGWESRGTALRGFVPDLLKAGYRVVAFDGPAHGDSEGKYASVLNFGIAINALVEKLDGQIVSAITHSFGGACIVYTLAHIAPDLHLEKLVMISASASSKGVMTNYLNLIGAPSMVRKKWFEFIESKINVPIESVAVSTSRSKIKVSKAMIIHDELDMVTPIDEAKEIASNWEDSILVVTKGYGHFMLVKNPDLVDRVCKFIVE